MSTETGAVLERLAANEEESIRRLVEWLRIESISTDPAYKRQCREAAQWAAEHLRGSGLRAELRETDEPDGSGHPVVWATCEGESGAPHVLFYGHYDVQPADPLELWESPPFEPVIREAGPSGTPGRRVVARGACDDKGQVMMFLEALRAWAEQTGAADGKSGLRLPGGVRLTVLLEGEEESASVNLERFIERHREEIGGCDFCLISDTGMLSRTQPAITYGVRGLAYTEVTLHGPDQDLHSGHWGGRAPNPNNLLARVLGGLWDEKGRVTIPGFYERVLPLRDEEREAWRKLPFDAGEALAEIGLAPEADVGEEGYTALERTWARPTCDINGIVGGYTGAGAKTVIPSKASAKVSFRLVAEQDPREVKEAFFAWLRERTPPGCRWELKDHGHGFPATVSMDSPWLAVSKTAVREATGVEPAMIKAGGSIPVAGLLKQHCDLDTVFLGFGLDDDRVHSPNEKFEIECFRMGARSHAVLLGRLGSAHR